MIRTFLGFSQTFVSLGFGFGFCFCIVLFRNELDVRCLAPVNFLLTDENLCRWRGGRPPSQHSSQNRGKRDGTISREDWVVDKDGKKTKINGGPYYAHIDLAKVNDACGFCVTHIVGSRQVSRGFGREKKFETRPLIRVDIALEVVAPPSGEIRISSIRELLYKLRDMGLQFQTVSYDSWGSEESIQILKAEGFNAENLSVDKDSAPYEAVKEAIYDGRLLCYDHPRLAMQLATIRKDDKTGKIDHPPQGQKDISDRLAGAVWHAEKAFSEGVTGQWANVKAVQTYTPQIDDSDLLWEKVYNNIPLTEAEIARLK
jgi:hypothetical protein